MQPINYNPMQNFNNVFNSQMTNINTGMNNADILKGGISTTIMPEDFKDDKELQTDLKILNKNGAGQVAKDFSATLSNSLTELNDTQRTAEVALETFATGGDIDVHSVMIAAQKASLSMNMAMQLRNKAIQAYQEIYRMNV